MSGDSCEINDNGSSCCTPAPQKEEASRVDDKDFNLHWNNVYLNSPEEKLGWYETDLKPMLDMITKTKFDKSARILNVGAGSTRLVDELLAAGYSNLLATDLSDVALKSLAGRVGDGRIECIVDDLTNPVELLRIDPVDIWIDRAVLHFFNEQKDQEAYFDLLYDTVNNNGYALFAEYNLSGADKCAGLPVHRYSTDMISSRLGKEFQLVENFDYSFIMPSGAERPYTYSLFRKILG